MLRRGKALFQILLVLHFTSGKSFELRKEPRSVFAISEEIFHLLHPELNLRRLVLALVKPLIRREDVFDFVLDGGPLLPHSRKTFSELLFLRAGVRRFFLWKDAEKRLVHLALQKRKDGFRREKERERGG